MMFNETIDSGTVLRHMSRTEWRPNSDIRERIARERHSPDTPDTVITAYKRSINHVTTDLLWDLVKAGLVVRQKFQEFSLKEQGVMAERIFQEAADSWDKTQAALGPYPSRVADRLRDDALKWTRLGVEIDLSRALYRIAGGTWTDPYQAVGSHGILVPSC